MDADPESKATILRLSGARLCQLLLNGDAALHGIDCARELGQHTVASGVGDLAAMLLNEPVHNLTGGAQGVQRPGLVLAYKAAVARDVSGEDRCQTPFDPVFLLRRHRSPCR